MERFYEFAGIRFRVCAHELPQDEGMLTEFRTDAAQYDHAIHLELTDELSPPEGELVFSDAQKRVYRRGATRIRCFGNLPDLKEPAYMQIFRQGKESRVLLLRSAAPENITSKVILNALEAEHFIARQGGFLLHASFLHHRGKAILFTAPSGTGKSTQAALWERLRGAELVNGDRVCVMPDGQGFVAQGIPFCGSSGVAKNKTFPIAAIVYLSQGKTTQIHPLSGLQAFRSLWEGCSVNTWDADDVSRCTDAVMAAARQVPVYHLSCLPDESAVQALENMLKEGA